jgi:2-polyprenyl-3-methyl-5-hydroxy-6-metoxy-1,4-benzoquinol methylase
MITGRLKAKIQELRIPKTIRSKFRSISQDEQHKLRTVIIQEYIQNVTYSIDNTPEKYLSTEEGKFDLENHLIHRLNVFRNFIIPWLSSIRQIEKSNVLEIGSGTGCSTLALGEQGASVTGIDIDEASIKVARFRTELYGVKCTFLKENAVNINRFTKGSFDTIIFFASLEHMTIDERIDSLRKAWDLLSNGGVLAIIETPNRLWFKDDHTAMLPFFHWLPDQLAYYYSSVSPRVNFYRFSNELGSQIPEIFHRLGRGVSYHEFEIALGKDVLSNVAGDLYSYLLKRRINPLSIPKAALSIENRYSKLLKKINPSIDSSFFNPYLNLAFMKRS